VRLEYRAIAKNSSGFKALQEPTIFRGAGNWQGSPASLGDAGIHNKKLIKF
jgi:hypothetical protein